MHICDRGRAVDVQRSGCGFGFGFGSRAGPDQLVVGRLVLAGQ
jgi:hypothetical protein